MNSSHCMNLILERNTIPNQSDEISIDLFHIIKVSNIPKLMFDRIMNWVKHHKGNLVTNGSNDLLKRDKSINNMNHKLYNNKIVMKPEVDLTHLSFPLDSKK